MTPSPNNHSLISSTLLANKFDRRQDKNDENEYEEGDVTGYALQHPGILASVGRRANRALKMKSFKKS